MYKLIAIDLDGTLLNSYGEISIENKQAIQKAMIQGSEIVLASGRVISSVKNFSKEIGVQNFLISGNGSTVYDIKNEKILYNHNLPKEKVLKIVKLCEENSIYYSVYTDKRNYNKIFSV